MELLTLKKIELNKTVRKATDPFEFELEMHCKEALEDKVIFTILYTVDVSNDSEDQVLSETEIFPIPQGNLKFTLEADAPELKIIPNEQLFGLTSIIIIGKYKEEQFMRVGYIVDVYYPGIPNDKLLYNEDDAEDIEDEDPEEEEEDENENFDDLVVKDDTEDIAEDEEISEEESQEENVEEKDVEEGNEGDKEKPKTFTDAIAEKVAEPTEKDEEDLKEEVQPSEFSEIKEELEKPVFEEGQEGDVFEFRGYKINRNNIELNVMVPPSICNYLIKWKENFEEAVTESIVEPEGDDEAVESEEECSSAKKVKREE